MMTAYELAACRLCLGDAGRQTFIALLEKAKYKPAAAGK